MLPALAGLVLLVIATILNFLSIHVLFIVICEAEKLISRFSNIIIWPEVNGSYPLNYRSDLLDSETKPH